VPHAVRRGVEAVPGVYGGAGSPASSRLVDEFRLCMVEEIAAGALPGLIFTYGRAFDDPAEETVVVRRDYAEPPPGPAGRMCSGAASFSADRPPIGWSSRMR
jgi:hypothetical protein